MSSVGFKKKSSFFESCLLRSTNPQICAGILRVVTHFLSGGKSAHYDTV